MAKFFGKKKLVVALATAAISVFAVAAAGCKEEVEQISITRNNSPQTTYVLGSELNLSSGKLTAIVDGERREIPLSDAEISISGYNKDQLGEQILTVTYKEQTTLLKVNVVPRIMVVGHEDSYFVGETLDRSKGQLTITADNGQPTIVAMDSELVSVTGFDSSNADSELPITIAYEDYSTTINVAIYEPTSVHFNAPSKQLYKSHESGLDVTGGYLTLRADDVVRNVIITADMVSGFDLSAATVAHRADGLMQTLTVDYCGYQREYEVEIKFSDVSLINLRADEMDDLSWTSAELPEACTVEMGNNALEAMAAYFKMEKPDLSLLEEGAIDHIVKVATVYGLEKWMTAFGAYSDAFYFNESGSLSWKCEDFSTTNAAYQSIADKDPVLYQDGATLTTIREKFADTVLFGETLIGGHLSSLLAPSTIDELVDQLKLMIDLHNALKDIPADWATTENGGLELLKDEYADEIYKAWSLLYSTKHKALQQRSLYLLTSNWREKNDFFEILYTFYYDYYVNDNPNPYPETDPDAEKKFPQKGDLMWINAFKDLRLPGELEVLYTVLLNVRSQLIYTNQGYMPERTNFLLLYESALRLRDEIQNSSSSMIKDLYTTLEFDYLLGDDQNGYQQASFDMLFYQYRCATNGYAHTFNVYLGVDAYEKLWKDYTDLLATISQSGAEKLEVMNYAEEIEGLFNSYLALTPKQQFAFMELLHPYYRPSMQSMGYPTAAWANDGEKYLSPFTELIYTYYKEILPESTHDIFTNLLLAQESLARLGVASDIQSFRSYMEIANGLIDYVSGRNATKADWAEFSDKLSGWLMSLETYDEKFDDNTMDYEVLTDAEQELIWGTLDAAFEAYCFTVLYNQNGVGMMVPFLAAVERLEAFVDVILASENTALHRAYYFDTFAFEIVTFPDGSQGPWGGDRSLEMWEWFIRDIYTKALTSMPYTSINELIYDAYEDLELKEYLANASYLYYNAVVGVPDKETNLVYHDFEKVVEIAQQYRALSLDQRMFLYSLDSKYNFYMIGMTRFALDVNPQLESIIVQLLNLERACTMQEKQPDQTDKNGSTYTELLEEMYIQFLTKFDKFSKKVEAEKKKTEDRDEMLVKALDDLNTYFSGIYNYCTGHCSTLFPDAQPETEEV